jgi:SAM-dependent methyltransferase
LGNSTNFVHTERNNTTALLCVCFFLKTKRMIGSICRCLTALIVLVALLIASFLTVLDLNPALQRSWFAWLLPQMLAGDTEMTALRCQHLSPLVHGRVMEIGFGTGVNLQCFNGTQRPPIKLYVGVEPNTEFESAIADTLRQVNISFPFRVDAGFAEDLSAFDGESFDVVISTHVLCSVENIDAALGEIHRVLVPGGQFVFFEHTTAAEGTTALAVQQWIARPWRAFTAGCKFVDIARALQRHSDEWLLEIVPFSAPLPLPIVQPHVRGTATKKK